MTEQSLPSPTPETTSRDTRPIPNSDWAAARGAKWRAQLAGMEATLAPVDEPLIRALQLDLPARIAEIGCGGGGTAIALLKQAKAGSVVHGFDISPALIEAARQRAPLDERALAFETRDMATATAPGAPYDRLVSRFGIMFFGDPARAFVNLVPWLVPGGRFAFATWGHPVDNRWLTSVRDVVAEFVDVPALEPDAPGPFRYADADPLIALLDRAGFTALGVRDWHGALPIGGALSAAAAANFALAAFSSFDELLAKAGAGALEQARRSLTERFSQHHHDGAVRMDACVRIFTGVRS